MFTVAMKVIHKTFVQNSNTTKDSFAQLHSKIHSLSKGKKVIEDSLSQQTLPPPPELRVQSVDEMKSLLLAQILFQSDPSNSVDTYLISLLQQQHESVPPTTNVSRSEFQAFQQEIKFSFRGVQSSSCPQHPLSRTSYQSCQLGYGYSRKPTEQGDFNLITLQKAQGVESLKMEPAVQPSTATKAECSNRAEIDQRQTGTTPAQPDPRV
ncbi:hypothetical protein L6452_36077 [Arctium lappa]|uniref:Uncharacterized protein n=1 Tax=Arctium lappa TaxID=4217 RepID=A0ACB8Y8Q0_ARCLA|nr:hypothetical protein L6452_36077 [Arctium lappa]